MSGVYLTVWDFKKDAEGKALYDQILQTTKGGYPHITVFYSGKAVPFDTLKRFVAEVAFPYFVTQKPLGMKEAYVNSFQLSDGRWRHDCLLRLDDETTKVVQHFRETYVQRMFPDTYAQFSMHPPHVTLGIHWTREKAQAHMEHVNAILNIEGPRAVEVVGATV